MYKPQLEISLSHLRYLSVISRRKTLSAAAIDLGVTQPALSLAVKEIEQQLGTKLFEKRGREKLLTAAGILAVQFADRTLHEAKELAESLRDENQLVRGTLSVGMIDASSLYLLPAAISAFRKVAPEVEIQIVVADSDTLAEQLKDFQLDVAFVVSPPDGIDDSEDFTATVIVEEALLLCTPDIGAGSEPGEWALYPSGSRTRALIDRGLQSVDIRPYTTVESANPQILRQMVSLGLATSVLPESVANNGESITVTKEIARRKITCIRRANSPDNPKVNALVELGLTVGREYAAD